MLQGEDKKAAQALYRGFITGPFCVKAAAAELGIRERALRKYCEGAKPITLGKVRTLARWMAVTDPAAAVEVLSELLELEALGLELYRLPVAEHDHATLALDLVMAGAEVGQLQATGAAALEDGVLEEHEAHAMTRRAHPVLRRVVGILAKLRLVRSRQLSLKAVA